MVLLVVVCNASEVAMLEVVLVCDAALGNSTALVGNTRITTGSPTRLGIPLRRLGRCSSSEVVVPGGSSASLASASKADTSKASDLRGFRTSCCLGRSLRFSNPSRGHRSVIAGRDCELPEEKRAKKHKPEHNYIHTSRHRNGAE